MFKKLKEIFKSRSEKNTDNETETSERKIQIKYGSEKIEWDILENNPGYITSVMAHDNSEFYFVYILYGILEEKGLDVELLNGKYENDKWIHVKDNGYYLLPLLINFSHDEDSGFKMYATIQVHHREIFPDGIFEYVYPQEQAVDLVDGLFDLFRTWVDLDWETLTDCLNLKNSKYMSVEIELEDVVKHVFYGSVLSYPNVDAEKFCDDLLDQKGVLVCHGDCFYLPHTFRLSLSHASHLEEGIKLIDEYLDELAAQGKADKIN